MYADVLIEYPVKSLDKVFTYSVNEKYVNIIKRGMKVVIPFNNSLINGIVLNTHNNKPDFETKEIIRIEHPDIYLNEELLELGKFLKEETLCSLIVAYQTMLPSSLKVKWQERGYDKFDTYIRLNDDIKLIDEYVTDHKNAFKQIEVINFLKDKKVLKNTINSNVANLLIKNNIVIEEKVKVNRINPDNKKGIKNKLNEEQQKAFDSVDLNNYSTYLLEGVTGSGKTEVYMQLIESVINNGKNAIVLVPEICLTTQTVKRFYDRFGSDVAVFHSGLSDGEKYDEYLKIYNNEVHIVVGTRSSIFVPFNNIGIIIIDEEHSDTYKQENTPRYDTINVAIFRSQYHKCPLILASATPTLESRARAIKGVYKHLFLKHRANGAILPNIEIIDMNKEVKKGNLLISNKLKESIQNCLDNKEQSIILLNRRGFSTFISCSNCGYTYKCPNCDITLTYHKTTNNLRCHYCGYYIKKDDVCPKCGEDSLNYLGTGTQKIEELLKCEFPSARIVRMDQDTTSKKGSYQKILDDFADYKYDILLGTQMISKGLDFPLVTLVGIINADTSLNIPDFRANERTFSLLYQTAGRSGRSKKEGNVYIQTFNPDNDVLNYVCNNDYDSFYKYEMDIRHHLLYPPYRFLCLLIISSKSYEDASKEISNVKKILLNKISSSSVIIGPAPAGMFRINNVYHFSLIIKYTFDNKLKDVLKELDDYYSSNSKVNFDITFNPIHF